MYKVAELTKNVAHHAQRYLHCRTARLFRRQWLVVPTVNLSAMSVARPLRLRYIHVSVTVCLTTLSLQSLGLSSFSCD